jgi:RimJ/RimL family protein N-acetyltransferase
MIPLKPEQSRALTGYFPGVMDTALLSALQGHMGSVEADDPAHIGLIVARCGDYFYFGGTPDHPQAEAELKKVPAEAYLVSLEPAWQEKFKQVFGPRLEAQRRHIIKRDMSRLDREHLRALHAKLPEGFKLVRVDEIMAGELYEMPWSHEYVNQFRGARDFVERGFGYAVMHGQDIACVGVTFSLYDKGMEMGIATNPEYRRRGLATIAASRTVLEAMNRSWELNWDAANEISLKLAQKMGFEKIGEYDVFIVHCV